MHVGSRHTAEPFVTKDGSEVREIVAGETVARNQSLAEALLQEGEATQCHYHATSEEIYFVVEGHGEMELEGERTEVGPEDAVLIPPGAFHQIRAVGGPLRFLCICAPPYRHEDTHFER